MGLLDFKVYQVTAAIDLTSRGRELFNLLKSQNKFTGEQGLKFCITQELDFDENVITGCFSEEYLTNISSNDEDKATFVPEVEPYLNTFFAFDLQEKRIILENRRYPANNLKKDQTRIRLFTIIKDCFEEIYNAEFDYLNTHRNVDDDDFIHIFRTNRVSMLKVRLSTNGRLLSSSTKIFNEDDELLNSKWVQGWNSDQSGMHEIILKAPGKGGDGDLSKSPIALSLLNLPVKEIVEINYWDENETSGTMSRTDLRRFRIEGINLHTLPISAISEISREVYLRRVELRSFKFIEDLE